jgi:hypothetical protein
MFSSKAKLATDQPHGNFGTQRAPAPPVSPVPRGRMNQREAELDAELRKMQNRYRASGAELASRSRVHSSAKPISVLARWIVGRNVVAINGSMLAR